MNCTRQDLETQVARVRANGTLALYQRAAEAHGLPVALVVAIASRETNCQNELGDYDSDDSPRAVGSMQLDVQHQLARQAIADGSWRDNQWPIIDACCAILAAGAAWARATWPTYTERQWLKLCCDAYNGGEGGAAAGARHGNADLYTTGHDYGSDVLERMDVLEGLLT